MVSPDIHGKDGISREKICKNSTNNISLKEIFSLNSKLGTS